MNLFSPFVEIPTISPQMSKSTYPTPSAPAYLLCVLSPGGTLGGHIFTPASKVGTELIHCMRISRGSAMYHAALLNIFIDPIQPIFTYIARYILESCSGIDVTDNDSVRAHLGTLVKWEPFESIPVIPIYIPLVSTL